MDKRGGRILKGKICEYAIVYMIGSVGYCAIELLWRGYSHWTMTVTGGVCFMIIYLTNRMMRSYSVFKKCLVCAVDVTAYGGLHCKCAIRLECVGLFRSAVFLYGTDMPGIFCAVVFACTAGDNHIGYHAEKYIRRYGVKKVRRLIRRTQTLYISNRSILNAR